MEGRKMAIEISREGAAVCRIISVLLLSSLLLDSVQLLWPGLFRSGLVAPRPGISV
jgi:hypothetical protein